MPIDNALERKIGPHGVADKAVDDALDRAGGALDCELGRALAARPSAILPLLKAELPPGTAVRYGLFIKFDEAS